VSEKPRHEIPYLHVRPPKRIIGVGGEADRPDARIYGNETVIRRLIAALQRAPEADEGIAVMSTLYYEMDGRAFDQVLMRCTDPRQMGEPREPEGPDWSMFA
jgi:hypothetical protein